LRRKKRKEVFKQKRRDAECKKPRIGVIRGQDGEDKPANKMGEKKKENRGAEKESRAKRTGSRMKAIRHPFHKAKRGAP